jgi:hypothetical protein
VSSPASQTSQIEALLAQLPPEAAQLARSVLARVRSLGTVAERPGPDEVALVATLAGNAELARLLLRPDAPPRVAFASAARAPIDVTGLPAAAAAAEAIRAAAESAAARAPQLDLFGKKR